MASQMPGAHARIAVRSRVPGKSFVLLLPGARNPFPNCRGMFFEAVARDISIFNRRHFDMKIDPVEQGTGNSLPIPLNLHGTASAFPFEIAEISTGAGIHRRDQHEFAWES